MKVTEIINIKIIGGYEYGKTNNVNSIKSGT